MNIIVKVGKQSNLRFSHCKTIRAITGNEIVKAVAKYSDCHILIIEKIYTEEQEDIKQIAKEFLNKHSKNVVLFYIPDNDEITSGIADEIESDIYLNVCDLYKFINETFSTNVSVYLSDKKNTNDIVDKSGFAEAFSTFNNTDDEEEETNINEEIQQIDNKILDEPEEEIIEEPKEVIEEHTFIESKTEKETDKTENIEETNEKIIELKKEIRDLQFDYNQVVSDIKKANSRVIASEKIIETLKDEKDDIINRYNTLVETNNVLEDPISLEEYNHIEETLKEKETLVIDLQTNIENLNNSLLEKNTKIEQLQTLVIDLQEKLKEINNKIDSGEIHKDVLEQEQKKYLTLENQKSTVENSLNQANININTLQDKITSLNDQINKEIENKLNIQEKLNSTLEKLNITNEELQEKKRLIIEHENKTTKLTNELNNSKNKIEEQSNKIQELSSILEEANNRIELSENYNKEEKSKTDSQILELQTRLKLIQERLSLKEQQYDTLVRTSGLDETGASTLVKTNQSLEQVNRTLREQLGVTKNDAETSKREKLRMQTLAKQYEQQCNQLKETLKVMTETGGSVINNAEDLIKPIKYNGKARLINVFGCGSFGITTLAMSLASKYSIKAKVLYIDFDLVAPKADAWFQRNPLCRNIPGINPTDTKMTGLGIFYEKGIQVFSAYTDTILCQCEKTKGGCLDYLSGVYYRVDNLKLATADYSSLLTLLDSKHGYEYIIADLGRLGSSDFNDTIIKVMTDIAYRNVVVTTNDRFEVRNFRMKLNNCKISLENMAWFVNMCETTNMEERTKQSILPASYGMMPIDTDLYGKREKFTRNKITRDKLELFISSALEGKKG